MKRTIITVILTLALTAFAIQAVEQTAFSGAGVIESTTGGFKFPDGSVQTSAVSPPCTTITSLPFVILDEGVYCFTGNLDSELVIGNAITINADNVVIELNGWKLDGLGAGASTTVTGIYASQRKNITIRNGIILGFFRGIHIDDNKPYTTSQGHLVEDIHAVENTYIGINVVGTGNTVRHNRILGTGGSSVTDDGYGLFLAGPGLRALDNDISNTAGIVIGRGMHITSAEGAVIEGNRIDDVSNDNTVNEWAYGIFIRYSDSVLVRGNSISSLLSSLSVIDIGIHMYESSVIVDDNRIMNMAGGVSYHTTSSGKYRDNLTFDVTTPFTGGTDAGGND